MSRLLTSVVLSSTLLLGAAGCSKYATLAKTSLDASKPLVVTIDDGLARCADYTCLIAMASGPKELGSAVKLEEGSRLVHLRADGTWTLFEAGEEKDDKADDKADAKADDKADDKADGEATADEGATAEQTSDEETEKKPAKKKGKKDKEPVPDNWRETAETTYEARKVESAEKLMGNATKELATGTLADANGARVLEIAPDLLPEGSFLLYSNGHFGATYEGVALSSPTRAGSTKVSR